VRDASAAPGRSAIFRAWRRGLAVAAGTLALVAIALVSGRDRYTDRKPARETPAVVTVPEAAMKREPDARAETVAALKRGSEVAVIAERGAWIQVRSGGATGYVRTDEVEREDDHEAREERAKKILSFPAVFGVVAEQTPVLLAPFPFAPRAGALPKGTVIPIHAVDHAYFAYEDKANGVAFVASADVDLVPPDPKTPDIVADGAVRLKRLETVDLAAEPTPLESPMPPPAPAPVTDGVPAERPPAPPVPREPAEGTVEPAVLVSKVDPTYPEMAIRAQIEGSVVLDVGIDETGRVIDVQVTRGLPFGLSDAAAQAVRQWTYRPARGPGGPIPSRKSVRILFTLRGGR
jgi:TonB family protein